MNNSSLLYKNQGDYILKECKKRYNKFTVDHLAEISRLSIKNKCPIFPRNGFLLGIMRHNAFLPNEKVDEDLACLESDLEKMLKSNWGKYKLSLSPHFNNCWDTNFFNGERLDRKGKIPYYFVNMRNGSFHTRISIWYDYNKDYVYYPFWSIAGYNSEPEFNLVKNKWEKYGGGARIIFPNKTLPLRKLFKNGIYGNNNVVNEYKGRVGYLYKKEYLSYFVPCNFYDKIIYVPTGGKNLLKSHYGENVFDIMIDKKGNEIKLVNTVTKEKEKNTKEKNTKEKNVVKKQDTQKKKKKSKFNWSIQIGNRVIKID